MTDTQFLTENIDAILEAAKQIKAGNDRHNRTLEQEQVARDSVKTLQREAHATTTAMVNDEDMSQHRALSDIQKDLLKAHNKVDKAIDKSHDDAAVVASACKTLLTLVSGATENVDEPQLAKNLP
ncbi:hypothetical protein MHM84_14655 [Halomonas sp. McH1-25]|uniref:hypothetical protein n=1 Tax=unclassified Halomonas TaxID=2609666 RepID=UPI001EF66106|nr:MULTISPECIES: hypothetical protein [unclassified Halomonas]MCG7601022.1 hypothetical protein [Halomonas sp. McH1-25]MCP1342113.1 hypothetical protein [Halomonas sp. FL8]MCP1360598.1 hypothetical protein [Halomonas sp. BBD45]MCP1367146.1 hypothetical protein [Halomonas sp. BBD48]